MTLQALQVNLVNEINKDELGMVNYYFSQQPVGKLIGDRIHLSATGKTIMAVYHMIRNMPK
jgi:hypothetical protein